MTSTTDTNEVVTLVSIAVIDNSEMLIEVDVRKGRFPDVPSALTLDGSVPNNAFGPGNSNGFAVAGDAAAGGPSVNGVGVVDAMSDTAVSNDITTNPDRSDAYCGSGTTFAEPCSSGGSTGPDVENISTALDPLMTTFTGLNAVVAGIESNATSTTCPPSSVGSVSSPVVVVVSGDCSIGGNTTGWGLLVVKGALTMGGNVEWNGLVMVVDPAECDTVPAGGTHYAATLAGGTQINGGLFIASTYNDTLNDVCINTNGGGTGGIAFDSEKIRNASQGMPFTPIAIRHH